MEKDYLSSPSFKPEIIRSKSGAAAGLCGWVVNICKYFRIYQVQTLSLPGLAGLHCFLAQVQPCVGSP